MKNRTKVEIKHETKKAYLVTDSENRECWIQKRWLNEEDMTVNSETFDRGATHKARVDTMEKEARDYKNTFHTVGKVAAETEKRDLL